MLQIEYHRSPDLARNHRESPKQRALCVPTSSATKAKRKGKKNSKGDSTSISIREAHPSPCRHYPLTRSIVSHGQHTLQVPPRIIRILRNAIKARRQCTEWFLKQVNDDLVTDVSNEGHAHFTNILEEMLSLLQPFCHHEPSSTSATNRPENPKNEAHRTSHDNIFKNLEIEDPFIEEDAVAEGSPQPTSKEDTPTKKASVEPKVVYEVETEKEDVRFAVFCLFRDLDVLRQYLHDVWRKYACHETSLIEASAITNTGVEFVRRIEQSFSATYTQFSDWENVMEDLFPEAMTYSRNFYLQYSTTSEHLKFLRSFYFLPFQILVAYRDGRDQGKFPFLDDNYDPRTDHFGQSEQERWRRELILMMEVFREFLSLILNDYIITEDELILGLRKLHRDKKVHLWVVFALQAFVDIRNTLGKSKAPIPSFALVFLLCRRQLTFVTGEKVNRGLGELQDTGTQVKKMIDWYCHRSPELRENRVPDQEKVFKWLANNIDKWVLNDIFEDLKERTFKNRRSSANSGRPFLLLSQHPWLCGLVKCAIRMKIQREGFHQLDLQGLVVATAQLYHAVQHGERLNLPLSDMDKLAGFHSKSPFLESAAKTPVAAYQRLLLAHGASVVMFAQKRRTSKPVRAKVGEPIIFKQLSLIFALYRRFC